MGNSSAKDPNIDMYINLSKGYFFTGGQVSGQIIINFKKSNFVFHALYIKILGFQNFIADRHRKESFEQKKQKYKEQFILHRFDNNKIPQGIYSFPFSFVVPISLPGSLVDTEYENISYKLASYLVNFDTKATQYETQDLFLLQSSRAPISPITTTQRFNVGMCTNRYFIVSLSADHNAVYSGQNIKLRVDFDNQGNSKDVKDIRFLFQEKRIKYANQKNSGATEIRNQIPLSPVINLIQANKKKSFEFDLIVPYVRNSTAIGFTIANYHQIVMRIPNYCCFAKQIPLYLIVQEQQSFLKRRKKVLIPFDIRNAIVMPTVKYNNFVAIHNGTNRLFPFTNPIIDNRATQRQISSFATNPQYKQYSKQQKFKEENPQQSGKYFGSNNAIYLN